MTFGADSGVGTGGAIDSGVASTLAFEFAFEFAAFVFAVFAFDGTFALLLGIGAEILIPPSRDMPTKATFAESGDQTICPAEGVRA